MSNLKDIKTCELIEELKTREGVKKIMVDPYQSYSVVCESKMEDTGPAIILVIVD